MCIQNKNKVLKDIQGVLTDKEEVLLKLRNPAIAKLVGSLKIHKPGTEMRLIIIKNVKKKGRVRHLPDSRL